MFILHGAQGCQKKCLDSTPEPLQHHTRCFGLLSLIQLCFSVYSPQLNAHSVHGRLLQCLVDLLCPPAVPPAAGPAHPDQYVAGGGLSAGSGVMPDTGSGAAEESGGRAP